MECDKHVLVALVQTVYDVVRLINVLFILSTTFEVLYSFVISDHVSTFQYHKVKPHL